MTTNPSTFSVTDKLFRSAKWSLGKFGDQQLAKDSDLSSGNHIWVCSSQGRWIWVSNFCVSAAPRFFIEQLCVFWWSFFSLKQLTDSSETRFFFHIKADRFSLQLLSLLKVLYKFFSLMYITFQL